MSNNVLDEIVADISAENMYEHVLALEGIRHPVTGLDGLVKARQYIHDKFVEYGLDVKIESFRVDGCDTEFQNIIGVLDLSGGVAEEIVVSGHHDTVFNAPGANDNGSAVAAVLELARVFSLHRDKLPSSLHLRFVSFDLEEQHPGIEKRFWELGEETRVRRKGKFSKLSYKKHYKALFPPGSSLQKKEDRMSAKKKMEELSLEDSEKKYFEGILKLADEVFIDQWVGNYALLGSGHYVKNAVKEKRGIKAIVNFDTIGFTSERPHSQQFPKGIPVRLLKFISKPWVKWLVRLKMFRIENVKDLTVGNYINVIASNNSSWLVKAYLKGANHVKMPSTILSLPYSYEQIYKEMFDMLRSDHAPFWRQGIPGIFLSDSANFRYPYYHTESDIIDHMDFEFLRKVVQAVAGMLVFLGSSM